MNVLSECWGRANAQQRFYLNKRVLPLLFYIIYYDNYHSWKQLAKMWKLRFATNVLEIATNVLEILFM